MSHRVFAQAKLLPSRGLDPLEPEIRLWPFGKDELDIELTVALIKFASSSLLTKLHLKKKSGGRKTRRYLIGNQIPY